MKKWIVPSLLALALCLCLLPTSAAAKPWDTESGWTELTAALLSSNDYTLGAGKYYLNGDVDINGAIIMQHGSQSDETKYISLDLNGYRLRQKNVNASVIQASLYVDLTIQDSAGSGTITSANADADNCPDVGGIFVGTLANVKMTGGTIEGCWGKKAGAVHVYSSGKFTMTGGTITGCHGVGGTDSRGRTIDLYAGGVCVDDDGIGTFTMIGGTIEKCFSNDSTGGANLAVRTGSAAISGSATIGEGYGTSDNNKNYAVKLYSGTVNLADSAKIEGTYSVYVSAGTLNGAGGGTVTGAVLNRGAITGGTISGDTVSGATYTGTVTNYGTISGATIKTVTNYGTINNSKLGSSTDTDKVINCGTINGGFVQGAIVDTPAISRYGGISDETTISTGRVAYRWMVTFNSNGGSELDPVLCDENGKATKPADPTRDGWSLYGWYMDQNCTQEFDFNTQLTEDITLYAGWAKNISSGEELVNWYGRGNGNAGHWPYDYQGARYLRITEDFTLSASVTFTNDLTLDLNGHTIWCSDDAAIQVGDRGKCAVTITDRSGKTVSDQITWANVNQITDKRALVTVKPNNTLYLKNGTLQAVAVDGDFQMTGGTVDGYKSFPAVTVNSGGSFTMSGGTVKNSSAAADDNSVKVESGGSFTLTGGSVENTVKVSGTMNADGGIATQAEIASGGTITRSENASGTTEFTGAVTNGGIIAAGVYRGAVTKSDTAKSTVTGGLFYNPDGRTGDILTETNFNDSYRVNFRANGKPYAVAVVPSGSTAPAPDTLSADAYGRAWLGWYNGDDKWDFSTVVSDAVGGGVTTITLTAKWETDEQATGAALTLGQTYYFDLSALLAEGTGKLPGTVNSKENNPSDTNETLPDGTLHYVPFTYAGQVKTYTLSENQTDASKAEAATRILFMADANLVNDVSWNDLNTAGYIYGKTYAANGVSYTLRAPTGGSTNDSNQVAPGLPTTNDWDTLLSKEKVDDKDYIKLLAKTKGRIMINWAITQDMTTGMGSEPYAVIRRDAQGVTEWDTYWYKKAEKINDNAHPVGYRPVLELQNKADAKNLAVVTLDLNGGKLDGQSAVQLVVKSGASYKAPSATGLTRPDSSKDGTYFRWLGSDGNLYEQGKPVPASVKTLTAQWGQTYSITYELNGGTNHSGNPAFYTTENKGITLQAPTKTGYTFNGWYDNAKFEGDAVTGIAATDTGAKTFYASWTANSYTVQFNANGGSGTMTAQSMTYDTSKALTANSFTRAGFIFNGWSTDAAAKNGTYTDKQSVRNLTAESGETVTLYAVWKDGPANTLRLDGNGGLKGDSRTSDTYWNSEYAVLRSDGSEFTREGYTFAGWYSDADGDGKLYRKGDNVPFAVAHNGEIVTLYAQWTPARYTITYALDGGTNNSANPATYTIESATITLAEPTREGYTFLGWTWDGQTTPVKSVTIEKGSTGAKTLYAHWQQLYTVLFDANGGTVATASAQTDASGKLTLTALPTPTRSGYRFGGWYTEQTDGTEVTLGQVYTANTTLYAHWSYIPVSTGGTVTTPDAENGSVSVSDKTPSTGETVTIVAKPDAGYELGDITVIDRNGNEVELVKRGDGEYSFVVPSGGVTVKTEFVPVGETAFVDVPAGKYFYNAVNWAVSNGITSGTDATHFSPYASCTRGQLVTFLWRVAGKPEAKSTENPFTDVKETSSFYKAILWAAENGIVTGYSDGTFRPDQAVTRQQVAAILYRYAKFAKMDVSVGEDTNILSFNDATSISEYAIPAFQWAVGEQVITGNNGSLLPHDTCTRAQIVTMLYRLLAK